MIGKGGCTIKELEMRSGGKIQITPDSAWQGKSEPRPIKIDGTPQQLDWLKQLIAEKVSVSVESLASNATFHGISGSTATNAPGGGGSVSTATATLGNPVPVPGGGVMINVPNESVGLVIGRQGATIKMLEAHTGVKIQIAKECPASTPNIRPITLIGSQHSIESARQMIQAKVPPAAPLLDAIVFGFRARIQITDTGMSFADREQTCGTEPPTHQHSNYALIFLVC